LFREDLVDQQRRALDHAPGTAARTKAPPFAAEGYQVFLVTGRATHAQKAMLQAPALEVSSNSRWI
jgi:hypothetical protein